MVEKGKKGGNGETKRVSEQQQRLPRGKEKNQEREKWNGKTLPAPSHKSSWVLVSYNVGEIGPVKMIANVKGYLKARLQVLCLREIKLELNLERMQVILVVKADFLQIALLVFDEVILFLADLG